LWRSGKRLGSGSWGGGLPVEEEEFRSNVRLERVRTRRVEDVELVTRVDFPRGLPMLRAVLAGVRLGWS